MADAARAPAASLLPRRSPVGDRRIALPIARAAFVVGLGAALVAPLRGVPAEPPATIGPTVRVELPRGGTAHLPEDWRWTSSPPGFVGHGVLTLAASNEPTAVEGLLTGLGWRTIDPEDLTRDDAFVQVTSAYMFFPGREAEPLPRKLLERDAHVGSTLMGAPLLAWGGTGGSRTEHHLVTMWIGPSASPSVAAQARHVLARLRLPTR